jgi:hypothetical protein
MVTTWSDEDDDDDYEYGDWWEWKEDIDVARTICKVKGWTMDPVTGVSTLTFFTHKKLRAGTTWGLEVVNKVGRAVVLFTVN